MWAYAFVYGECNVIVNLVISLLCYHGLSVTAFYQALCCNFKNKHYVFCHLMCRTIVLCIGALVQGIILTIHAHVSHMIHAGLVILCVCILKNT